MVTHRRRPALRVVQLGSGSSGNATLVVGRDGAILVDAGFSARELAARITRAGEPLEAVRAILLSHAHQDHCRGAAVLARRLSIPIWGTPPTLAALPDRRGLEALTPLEPGRALRIAGVAVDALAVPHDAPGTVIFRLGERLGIATDLGVADGEVAAFLRDLDGLILEFNHDVDLLARGPYPPWLKTRILSPLGHLSNEQAAALLVGRGVPREALWLAHLSRQNNEPRLARRAAERAVGAGAVTLMVTHQDRISPPVILGER